MTSAISTSSPLSSGILNRRLTSWEEARFISTWKVSILPVKWLKATTAGMATKIPRAVETKASAMPPETTDIPPDPVTAMLLKALMIPTTVPKRPTNGAQEPIVARIPRPRFNWISVSDMESLIALVTRSSEADGSPPLWLTLSYSLMPPDTTCATYEL